MKKKCPSCFRLVGDETRAKIIQQLKKKSQKAGDIECVFSLTQPTISHHLKVLKESGVVKNKKKGREVYYSLNKKCLCKNCRLLDISLKI